MKNLPHTLSLVLGISIILNSCVTPARMSEITADPIHLVAVVVRGPETISSPERRRLIDAELSVNGDERKPFILYRVPAGTEFSSIDLAVLKDNLRDDFEATFRQEAGVLLAPAEETDSLPCIETVADKEAFEEFLASQTSGTFLYVEVEIEPDLDYPRVSGDFETDNGAQITFRADENVPRTIQIDLSSRIDIRTPERPSRNLLRFNFNRNYARAGTPDYPTEVIRRPVAVLASDPPGPIVVGVRGGTYRSTLDQAVVASDLSNAARQLGERALVLLSLNG